MKITNNLTIDDGEIKYKFTRSPGPGGQNVNKLSTSVRLYYDIAGSKSLPVEIRKRLLKNLKGQLTKDGKLILRSGKFRYQNLNRIEVTNKFKNTIIDALKRPRMRIPTKPSLGSQIVRLSDKRLKGILKKNRRILSSEL